MRGGEDLALPYRWIMRNLITVRGQWMDDTAAIPCLIGQVRGGLLDLGQPISARQRLLWVYSEGGSGCFAPYRRSHPSRSAPRFEMPTVERSYLGRRL
jgi:hypothetical protein